jgi:hypothetical protein
MLARAASREGDVVAELRSRPVEGEPSAAPSEGSPKAARYADGRVAK